MSELVIYLLVRMDLKMGKGKIAAQCGHAIQHLTLGSPKELMDKYIEDDYTKICLKIKDEEELLSIKRECESKSLLHYEVVDLGRTQIEANTKTVLGIGPIEKEQVSDLVKDLKLL